VAHDPRSWANHKNLKVTNFSLFTRDTHARKWAAVMCLVVIAALLCIQTSHSHQGLSSAEQAHCSICAAIHATSMALFVAPLLFAAALTFSFRRNVFDSLPKSRPFEFSLSSRPPPVLQVSSL
jgi:hypothetical protein